MKDSIKIEKYFNYKGHDCICVFTRGGFRNGYVSVKEPKDPEYRFKATINCYGGITYDWYKLPFGKSDNFYIGFDCCHYDDGVDFSLAYKYDLISSSELASKTAILIQMAARPEATQLDFNRIDSEKVKSLAFVIEECKKVVDQLEDMNSEDFK